jgi:hypothetical protein
MRNRSSTPARVVALIYAAVVIAVMSLSFWPNTQNGSGLLAVLLSLPWGLGVVLALDTANPELIRALAPPLVAICGLLNAFLLYNALRPRSD